MHQMSQFKVEKNQYGNIRIWELVWRSWGQTWVVVALKQYNSNTGIIS